MASDADNDPNGVKGLEALTDQIRASAKWLIGAFAAVGAALVPGLQLAGIGSLDGWRLVVALAACAVGVAAAIAAATSTAQLLTDREPTLADLVRRRRYRRVAAYIDENGALFLEEAKNLHALQERYGELERELEDKRKRLADARRKNRQASAVLAGEERELEAVQRVLTDLQDVEKAADVGEQLEEAGDEVAAAPHSQHEAKATETRLQQELDVAEARLAVLKQASDPILAVAGFQAVRLEFQRQRWLTATATLLVAAAVAAFAVAVHKPEHEPGDFSKASLVNLDLSGTNLEQAEFNDAHLENVDLRGSDMDGAELGGARFENTLCPDGTNSDRNPGKTCAHHIYIPQPPGPVATTDGPVDDAHGRR